MLTSEERLRLRDLAVDAVRATLTGREFALPLPDSGPLSLPGSCFVTVYRKAWLRGCVGLIGDRHPLAGAVREAAVRSLADPRFPPLSAGDLPLLTLEVSVLSPFRPLADPARLEIGVHGVHLSVGYRSALFLPKVPVEQGWDRERLFEELCSKAGLPGGAWAGPGAEISVFTAEVF